MTEPAPDTSHGGRSMTARLLRLLGIFLGVFAIGIGLGAGLGVGIGTWLIGDGAPKATVEIAEPKPLYSVPVRAYRPPLRGDANVARAPEFAPSVAVLEPEEQSLTTIAPGSGTPKPVAPVPVAPVPVAPEQTPPTAASQPEGWRAYAVAATPPPGRPMIAIVLDDLGIDQKRSYAAIDLPGPLTLSFIPYGYNLPVMTRTARAAGHELMVHVNMEPIDHGVDPGPNALLTSLKPAEVQRRLNWALSRFEGYTGLSNHMGSRFTVWPDGMEIVLRTLNRRGLLFLDSLTNQRSIGPALARAYKTPYAVRDVFIDHDRTDAFVVKQLALTERLARRNGHAIAIGHPHDVTVNRLKQWLATVESRGFALVPVSAIVRRKAVQG
ncbi:MAG: divergent polysaccharide deacetylase family protein [Rhodospirillaceae bacterium]|jgi:uncharacterized protein|nr:divergent polysaccharide deacetylase family protein [Rhodospirillaceae bacterium]MBT5811882.1 divergent polysaccharide deacetylase family protein [Rhodospirillaceae bacterium]